MQVALCKLCTAKLSQNERTSEYNPKDLSQWYALVCVMLKLDSFWAINDGIAVRYVIILDFMYFEQVFLGVAQDPIKNPDNLSGFSTNRKKKS